MRWLAVFLLTLSLAVASAQSGTREALEREIRQFEALQTERENELEQIRLQLGTTAAELDAQIAERDAISAQLANKRREREVLLGEIRATETEREATEARIDHHLAELDEMAERVENLLLSLYYQRGSGYGAKQASNAKSFQEFRVRNYYLSLLAEQDVTVITELDTLVAGLEHEQQVLANQLAQLAQQETELAAVESQLAASEQQLNAIIAELDRTREGQLAQQAALVQEQQRIERSLGDLDAQLTREIERLRAEEAAARRAAEQLQGDREKQLAKQREADLAAARIDQLQQQPTAGSGDYVRPVAGATLISRFGERNNSYLGIRAAERNAPVVAIESGRIAAITYLGANFGYMVAVQHANDLVSISVNLRQPVVEMFDTVERGQIIGYLGGGTLTQADVLQLYARRGSASDTPFIDPAPLFGW